VTTGENGEERNTDPVNKEKSRTVSLKEILDALEDRETNGKLDLEIRGVAYDSRKVEPGFLFVALNGYALDGHDFIEKAVENGSVALVTEKTGDWRDLATTIQVPDSREALAFLAARFYDRPFEEMNLVGITGTNGKTTTSYILESILLEGGGKPGVIGTINYRYRGHTYPAPVTTPESLDLMRMMREMADAGTTDLIMEVSSHALDQGRTRGCPFNVAVFTNFSRDHLDYHQTMETYFEAKGRLFRDLGAFPRRGPRAAVINMDDPKGAELVAMTSVGVMTYGLDRSCDLRFEGLATDLRGLSATLIAGEDAVPIRSRLIGRFNIYNIMAASGAALSLGYDLESIAGGIERLSKVPGRLEVVGNDKDLTLIVDYAHTPDALLKAFKVLKPLTTGRLITVFGCGGERDKGKRYEMGFLAGQIGDLVIITSDNPRRENPMTIINQIEKGVRQAGMKKRKWEERTFRDGPFYLIEPDRRSAIQHAVDLAGPQDAVLIAGKGHEDYQILGTERVHFDDCEEAARAASLKEAGVKESRIQ
jgi:UDP-N-acetylmuramoyl-L-alanyl-D-glutamate--2,6-diaminopimelate ligase